MVLRPIQKHIVLENDGSGNMLCVFPDSVDRLKWVLWGQNWHRSRDINFDTLKSFFSCIPSRHGPERFILNVWIPRGTKLSRVSHSLYTLNKTTPESMCMSTTMILTRKLKISESVIRKWEIGIYPLVIYPVTYGLLKVSPDLCNLQKLTSTSGGLQKLPDMHEPVGQPDNQDMAYGRRPNRLRPSDFCNVIQK